MDKAYVIDTNALLDHLYDLNGYRLVLLSHVLRELEKHKTSDNQELALKAREVSRFIRKNEDRFIFNDCNYTELETFNEDYNKCNILNACLTGFNNEVYSLITSDALLRFKAKKLGIDVVDVLELKSTHGLDYTGVKELYLTSQENDQNLLSRIYEQPTKNTLNLLTNEYVYIWDKEQPTFDKNGNHTGYKLIDRFRFDGTSLQKLSYSPIQSDYMGDKIKPINRKQEMLFDLLQNKSITIKACLGKYGVGKDFIMLQHAMQMIEKGKFKKLIWARNNVELKNVPSLGILPGTKEDKLLEFAMPLADHIGGVSALTHLINNDAIEVQHLGSLRGRDIKDSLIYVTECQNNTKDHIKLLIGRVGKGSELWLNGDIDQTDNSIFKLNSSIEGLFKLKGNPLFGLVTLDKTERSDTASLAELIN